MVRILRLDGLRALAIICVFMHHHGLMDGGWMGVELFFILSGFLITGILRRSRNQEAYWKPFYIKRATRILPPVLLLALFVAHHNGPPARSVLAYVLFMGNFAMMTSFDVPQLGMLWSLAVEEHFYLVFPFAVRYMKRESIMRLLMGVILVEPFLRLSITGHMQHVHVFIMTYWTIFHLDGLAMGALLALLAEDPKSVEGLTRWSGPLTLAAAAVFLTLAATMPLRFAREANSHIFNLVGYTLISATCMGIVTYVLYHPLAFVSKILESRPMVFLGAISYGFYLYHLPIRDLFLGKTGLPMRPSAPLTFLLAVLVSWISFKFYERPIMAWGHRMASRYTAPGRASLSALPTVGKP